MLLFNHSLSKVNFYICLTFLSEIQCNISVAVYKQLRYLYREHNDESGATRWITEIDRGIFSEYTTVTFFNNFVFHTERILKISMPNNKYI
jgi:hypothetical protein